MGMLPLHPWNPGHRMDREGGQGMQGAGEGMGNLQLRRYETFPDYSETIWNKYYVNNIYAMHYVSRILRKIHRYWESISKKTELHKVIPPTTILLL